MPCGEHRSVTRYFSFSSPIVHNMASAILCARDLQAAATFGVLYVGRDRASTPRPTSGLAECSRTDLVQL